MSGPMEAEAARDEAGDAQVEVLLILGVAVAQVWRASYGEASFASVSVEPIEGAEGPGFVARATVGGIKLGEVARDRCAAMGRLIAATRVRGEIERRRADEAEVRRCSEVEGLGPSLIAGARKLAASWAEARGINATEVADGEGES